LRVNERRREREREDDGRDAADHLHPSLKNVCNGDDWAH
jgi:hypothetical protein